MVSFDRDHVVIREMRNALAKQVTEHKSLAEAFKSTREGGKPSLKAMLDLPLSDDANLIIDYAEGHLSKLLEMDEHDGLDFNGSENVYAHLAVKAQELANHFRRMAEDWMPTLCNTPSTVTLDQVLTSQKDCADTFRKLLELCDETKDANTADKKSLVEEITGQSVGMKKYEKTDTVAFQLDIPTFKSPRNSTDSNSKSSTKLTITINDESFSGDFGTVALRQLNMKGSEVIQAFNDSDVKFAEGNSCFINGKLVKVVNA